MAYLAKCPDCPRWFCESLGLNRHRLAQHGRGQSTLTRPALLWEVKANAGVGESG